MLCQAKGATSGLMPLRLFNHPGAGSEEFYSVQGAGHDQFLDNSGIGWHQGGVSSFISLLVSSSLGSIFLWSQFSSGGGLLPIKTTHNSGMCVRPLSIPFRELEVW